MRLTGNLTLCWTLLLCMLTGCARHVHEEPPVAAQIADFGETEIEVRSVKSLAVAPFNKAVRAAAHAGAYWPEDVLGTAFEFAGIAPTELQGATVETDVQYTRTHMLIPWWPPFWGRSRALVTIEVENLPDDAIYGERYQLWMRKSGRLWQIERALWAQRGRRTEGDYYTAERVP